MSEIERLLLLVGSNPLPNYLVASQLRPREVVLLYTKETEETAKRLEAALRESGRCGEVRVALVEDATSATAIARAVSAQMGGATTHLNYTGGTKVMSAHALGAFYEAGGQEERASYKKRASYLEERGAGGVARLRFDDGREQALTVGVSLEVLLRLHDFTRKERSSKAPAPSGADAREILRAVLEAPALAGELHKEKARLLDDPKGSNKEKKAAESLSCPFVASAHGLKLSVPELPTEALKGQDWFKQWCKFIGGEWLEEWVGALVEALLGERAAVHVGVNAFREVSSEKVQLEVDVVVIQGHRAFFISCTTDTTRQLCKSKLLEVGVRSRQLGGDLAQAALVCLADQKTTEALRREASDVWGASNTTAVFGLEDLRLWAGCEEDGVRPNTETLRSWLGVMG